MLRRVLRKKEHPTKELKEFQKSHEGWFGSVHFFSVPGRKLAVKKAKSTDQKQLAEVHALQLLNRWKKNVRAPKLVHFDRNNRILVEDFVEGSPLTTITKDMLSELAKALIDIHKIRRPGFGSIEKESRGTQKDCLIENINKCQINFRKLRGHFAKLGLTKGPFFSFLLKAIKEIEKRKSQTLEFFGGNDFSLLHMDLVPSNIIIRNGKAVLVDWGEARSGDVAQEIANFFNINRLTKENCQFFLKEYAGPKSLQIQRRISVYRPLNLFLDVTAYAAIILEATNPNIAKTSQYRDLNINEVRKTLFRDFSTLYEIIINQKATPANITTILRGAGLWR